MVEKLCTTCTKPIRPEAKTRSKHRCLCDENQSEAQLETLKKNSSSKSSYGGAREGAGRPKGSMNEETKVRMAAKRNFIQRVAKVSDHLFNSQYNLAVGETYLMVKRIEGEGKNRKVWHEVVTDPKQIIEYLDSQHDGHDPMDDESHFYYITTKPADNKALDSLLNRAFGKPEEKLDVTSGDEPLGNPYSALTVAELRKLARGK